MSVISITGTSGVGKSFLVKQLSEATKGPGFFEGEEGTIPKEILENIFSGGDPKKRWVFFLDRYRDNFNKARKISDEQNVNCFVDGGLLNAWAILVTEKEEYKKMLTELISTYTDIKADKTILLIASEIKIREFFALRSRQLEQNEAAIKRALTIQDEFKRLAKHNPELIIIDRSNLDFGKQEDLRIIKDLLTQ